MEISDITKSLGYANDAINLLLKMNDMDSLNMKPSLEILATDLEGNKRVSTVMVLLGTSMFEQEENQVAFFLGTLVGMALQNEALANEGS